MRIKNLLQILGVALVAAACGHNDEYAPKPVAYLRFDFPAKEYTTYDTLALPFSFERAQRAQITIKKNEERLKWIDITYPEQNGIVFLSYIALDGPKTLRGEIDTSYYLLKKHFQFSSGVDEERFVNPTKKVYATTYRLKGSKVASTYQFWATDSCRHFLRGSLYLNGTPNNDSLAPVLDYLQQDLTHLLETLEWRD